MERLIFGILDFTLWTPHFSYWFPDCVFSHDVMAAIFVSQNNETAAMFVSQTSPVGVEFFSYLRANVCNFRESVDSLEFLNFFIFCSNNLYSTLISKITLKLVTAFYFFRNQAKFEKL